MSDNQKQNQQPQKLDLLSAINKSQSQQNPTVFIYLLTLTKKKADDDEDSWGNLSDGDIYEDEPEQTTPYVVEER